MGPQKKIIKPSLETLYLSSEKKITCMEGMALLSSFVGPLDPHLQFLKLTFPFPSPMFHFSIISISAT